MNTVNIGIGNIGIVIVVVMSLCFSEKEPQYQWLND